MAHLIKFCPNNFKKKLQETKTVVKQLPDVQVMENKCLNYCGQCIIEPFAIVNGKGVFCKTIDGLYPAIREKLANSPAEKTVLSEKKDVSALI